MAGKCSVCGTVNNTPHRELCSWCYAIHYKLTHGNPRYGPKTAMQMLRDLVTRAKGARTMDQTDRVVESCRQIDLIVERIQENNKALEKSVLSLRAKGIF